MIHQQLERAVEQCGVPASEAVITYEDWLQGEQIVVKSTSLTDEQLRCLSALARRNPYPVVFFENAELTKRDIELQHQQHRREAREWLRARNLLATLPSYDPQTESISEFARRIERFCGIEAGSVLTMHDVDMLTLKSEWADDQVRGTASKISEDKFWCLMNAVAASNLEEQRVRFGIIGNEAYLGEESPK
jgi:hypothetical protein